MLKLPSAFNSVTGVKLGSYILQFPVFISTVFNFIHRNQRFLSTYPTLSWLPTKPMVWFSFQCQSSRGPSPHRLYLNRLRIALVSRFSDRPIDFALMPFRISRLIALKLFLMRLGEIYIPPPHWCRMRDQFAHISFGVVVSSMGNIQFLKQMQTTSLPHLVSSI